MVAQFCQSSKCLWNFRHISWWTKTADPSSLTSRSRSLLSMCNQPCIIIVVFLARFLWEYVLFLDQELISYHFSSCSCSGDLFKKRPRLRRFKSDRDEIFCQDYSSCKYASIGKVWFPNDVILLWCRFAKKPKVQSFLIGSLSNHGVRFLVWHCNIKMAAMTSFHTKKCHRLASKHEASVCLCSNVCQFLIYSAFVLVESVATIYPLQTLCQPIFRLDFLQNDFN